MPIWMADTERPYKEYHSDPDAVYAKVYNINAADIVPTVAFPHLPSNTRPAAEARDITIDQSVIGSCTNGRIEDMRQAAAVLKGHKVNPNVRCIIIPATQQVYRQCIEEGLMDIFLDANCAVSTPTCGPCLGGYMGILAAGERSIATTNRNFVAAWVIPRVKFICLHLQLRQQVPYLVTLVFLKI